MSAALHSLIEVQLHWAVLHHWSAGRRMYQEFLPAHCLWVGRSGTAQAHDVSGDWKVSGGEALLIAAGTAREIRVGCDSEWISIGLRAAAPGHSDLMKLLPTPSAWRPDERDALSQLALQLVETPGDDGASTLIRDALARALFGRLWQRLCDVDLSEATGSTFPDWLSAALRTMRESPALKMAEVAHEVGISPSQLRRGFHEYLSTSPQEYSRRKRLEAACRAIETTDLPLHCIAQTHGFSSAALFSRAVRKAFGLAPVELRQAAKQPPV